MTTHHFDLARIGAGLPVAAAREALERAATGALVVTAPPGTGKTTFLPPLVANLVRGSVIVTQPRRVAVRAAAQRIATLDGSAVGGFVGFTVRGERRLSAATQIEVVTPGVLLRRLIADPGLDGVGAVVLDEVHERSLDTDLLLGMLAEVRELRDDLLLVAMSATLDATLIAEIWGGGSSPAPIIEVPSPLHPLRVDYAPFSGQRLDERGVTRAYLAYLAEVTREAQAAAAAEHPDACDALVFVPGAREVDEVVRLLGTSGPGGLGAPLVLPLHGRLAAKQQDLAVRGRGPGDAPRIVVSTALAESSLTVPGVRLVVDAGLSRELRRDRARDMAGLVTVSAARASAEQRAGRAARQGPGRVVRAYTEADFARMPAHVTPEIASADLVDAALQLAAWGTPGAVGLRLPEAPPAATMARAVEVLRALGLCDAAGRLTDAGAHIARLPLGAREARALLAGVERCGATVAAEAVAAVSGEHRAADGDLSRLLRELRTGRAPGAASWRAEASRLAALAREHGVGDPGEGTERAEPAAAGVMIALTRPDWIGKRMPGGRSYLLASGTRAALPEGSQLAENEWLAVREVQRASGRAADGTGAVIRLAAGLDEQAALELGGALVTRTREAQIVDGRVRVRELRQLGAITLAAVPVQATTADTGPAFAGLLRRDGLAALEWSETAQSLRGRLAMLHRTLGEPWPEVSDAALLASLDDWLGSALAALGPGSAVASLDTSSALRGLLPWPEAARLDELAPERLAVPSGSQVRIAYPDPAEAGASPVVAVKLQEVFGLADTPRLAGGRVPVLFHLLSPARKPLAVTGDLASFWNGPYQEVRKEMRGRYPKHPWPEDPWSAVATARTKRAFGEGPAR